MYGRFLFWKFGDEEVLFMERIEVVFVVVLYFNVIKWKVILYDINNSLIVCWLVEVEKKI